jgi:hypothetical protein
MANNFKIDGKQYDSKKSHYVVEKGNSQVAQLEKKLEKHVNLPLEKAHPKSK